MSCPAKTRSPRTSKAMIATSNAPPPRRGAVGRVRVGARPRTVDGPASPVRLVVPGLETGSGPVRYLVAAKARGLELDARGVELIPLEVGVDLGHTALGAAPIEKGAFFEREAIGGHMVGVERDRAAQRVQ